MSEADATAQQFLASEDYPNPTAPHPHESTEAGGSQGTGQPLDFIKMPLDTVRTLAKYYKDYKWVAKLARVKIPPEIDHVLTLIGQGDNAAIGELQQLAGGGSSVQTQNPMQDEFQEPPVEVGETVVTRKMAQKMYNLHEEGWGTRKIADYFTAKGSPISHGTVATTINKFEAVEKEGNQG